MSILKNRRKAHSKGEYVNLADDISVETVEFVARLSPRYGRIYTKTVSDLALKVYVEAETAQKIYTSDLVRLDLRKVHLLEARAALSALDKLLGEVYKVLTKNPEGAFTTSGKKNVRADDALRIIENLADGVGTKIDLLDAALSGVLESDQKLRKQYENQK